MNAHAVAKQDRVQLWRAAIAECLAIARGYASIAETGAELDDAAAFDYAMKNFAAAAKTALTIFDEDRQSLREAP